jgi:5'-3' exonuclease
MKKRPPRNGVESDNQIKQNTLLVDGNALFKTGFFGAKNQYNQNGQHIGGLYQFMTMLRKLLTDDLYHKVYIFWDGNFSGKLRYDIYKDYKKDRDKDFINGTHPIDVSELTQRKLIWDYLNEMYVRQIMHDIIEGDDFIAYYCLRKKTNEKITICTNDRDLTQFVSDDIKIYLCDLKIYLDTNNFSEYFCHHSSNTVLMKILTGDKSDTIKGIEGLGEQTLIKLFPEVKDRNVTLNEILIRAEELIEERKKEKKTPLKVLDNIVNRKTKGIQGTKIYEINERLVNLKKPMLTQEGIDELEQLIEGSLDSSGRDLKNVLMMMKRDGLDKTIGETRYPEFLIPFKKLIEREKTIY